MIAADWLLLGMICFCVMCLLAIFVGHMINTEWHDADEPIYRTADSSTLSADARAAMRQANNCTHLCNQGRCCTCSSQKSKGTP